MGGQRRIGPNHHFLHRSQPPASNPKRLPVGASFRRSTRRCTTSHLPRGLARSDPSRTAAQRTRPRGSPPGPSKPTPARVAWPVPTNHAENRAAVASRLLRTHGSCRDPTDSNPPPRPTRAGRDRLAAPLGGLRARERPILGPLEAPRNQCPTGFEAFARGTSQWRTGFGDRRRCHELVPEWISGPPHRVGISRGCAWMPREGVATRSATDFRPLPRLTFSTPSVENGPKGP
jgi:hypothetical protein